MVASVIGEWGRAVCGAGGGRAPERSGGQRISFAPEG